MDWTRLFELLLTIASSLVALYFLFIRSWLKTIASNIADLSTKKELTEIEERVKEDFNKKLEDYKAKINEELALRIEPLKSELEKNNITHHIQFGYLHRKRGEAMIEIYRRLINVRRCIVNYTSKIQTLNSHNSDNIHNLKLDTDRSIVEFQSYFDSNRIFYSESLCENIDMLLGEINYLTELFSIHQNNGFMMPIDDKLEEQGKMIKISQSVREELPIKIKLIENEFRDLLKV